MSCPYKQKSSCPNRQVSSYPNQQKLSSSGNNGKCVASNSSFGNSGYSASSSSFSANRAAGYASMSSGQTSGAAGSHSSYYSSAVASPMITSGWTGGQTSGSYSSGHFSTATKPVTSYSRESYSYTSDGLTPSLSCNPPDVSQSGAGHTNYNATSYIRTAGNGLSTIGNYLGPLPDSDILPSDLDASFGMKGRTTGYTFVKRH